MLAPIPRKPDALGCAAGLLGVGEGLDVVLLAFNLREQCLDAAHRCLGRTLQPDRIFHAPSLTGAIRIVRCVAVPLLEFLDGAAISDKPLGPPDLDAGWQITLVVVIGKALGDVDEPARVIDYGEGRERRRASG